MADVQHLRDHRRKGPAADFIDKTLVPFDRKAPAAVESSPMALAHLIEGEIIPRLLLAHRIYGGDVIPMTTGVIAAEELERFTRSTMTADIEPLIDHGDLLMRRGVSVDTLLFDLFSPAAKRLGEMWESDEADFMDVTVGLCRLQQLVYEFADRAAPLGQGGEGRTALFALTPGDQHTFGLVMVTEYFRRSGWRAVCMPDATKDDLVNAVRRDRFDLVGFSMANEEWLGALSPVISAMRKSSRNADLKVMVGGRAFERDPHRVTLVGADATASDARSAIEVAEALCSQPLTVA